MKRMIFIAETRPDNQVIRQESTPIPASDAAADDADNNASVRGESGRGEVRDDVDVDFVAMLLRGETRVHDGDRASGAEATPAAGPRADYRLRLTLDQWTPDGAVSGEITDIARLRLRFRSDYGTVTALDGSAVPQTQDLFRPLLLAVHRDDGSGIAGSTADTSRVVISVVAERLDAPVRIPDTSDATGRRGMRFFADPELAYERGTLPVRRHRRTQRVERLADPLPRLRRPDTLAGPRRRHRPA